MHVQLTADNAARFLRLSHETNRPVGDLTNMVLQACLQVPEEELELLIRRPEKPKRVSPRDTKPRRRRWRPVEGPWELPNGWRVRL
jgi:hypothetical protein